MRRSHLYATVAAAVISVLCAIGVSALVLEALRHDKGRQQRAARSLTGSRGWYAIGDAGYVYELKYGHTVAREGDAGLIRQLPQLEAFYAGGSGITDEVLRGVYDLPDVVEIDLSSTSITSDDLKDISRARSLVALDISDTRVCDRGLEHISRSTSLRILNAQKTRITYAGIMNLRNTNLRVLNLSKNAYTAEEAERLSGAFSRVYFYDSYVPTR